ncbi:MAG: AAA family ATPase [Actinobacteria bacterium]|nr:AAA family ATPase [Actinomycetota bacterium]
MSHDEGAMISHRATSPRFVGRRDQLDVLRAAFERASEGEASTVLAAGEAGIGKTRLIREFVGTLGSSAHVMYGACVPLADVGLPYGPVRDALRSFVRTCDATTLEQMKTFATSELSIIVPELAGPDVGSAIVPETGFAQLRMFELVLNLLEHLADERTVVLVLEDLHWADSSTFALVAFLIHNLREAPILLCLTYRDDELHRRHPMRPWLAEQLRQQTVVKLELPRFDRHETAEQLEGIRGEEVASEVIENLMAGSEGNPFLTEELAAALTGSEHPKMPGSLRELLIDRFLRLSDGSQALLRTAAVSNHAVQPWLVARVAGVPENDVYPALRDARDHHILVDDPDTDRFMFRHALLQEAVYSEVLPGERQGLHRRYAEELTAARSAGHREASEALPEIAYHWDAAHEVQQALPATLDAAAWASSTFAFGSARRYFERALELWSAVPQAEELTGTDHADVLFRAGHAAHLEGDFDRAGTLLAAAIAAIDEDSDRLRAASWHRQLAWCFFQASSLEKADAEIEQALRLSSDLSEGPERAGILGLAARLHVLSSRHKESWPLCQEALEMARRAGARREEGVALNSSGVVLLYSGRFDEAIAALRESLRIAEELRDPEALGPAYINLGEALASSGKLREGAEVSRRGYEATWRLGLEGTYGDFIKLNEAEFHFKLGDWDRTRGLVDSVQRRPSNALVQQFLSGLTAHLETVAGSFEAAEAELERCERMMDSGSIPELRRPYYEAVAELRLWQARPDDARASVAAGLDAVSHTAEASRLGHLLTLGLRAEADRAQLARARGAVDQASEAIAAARALLARAKTLDPDPFDPDLSPWPEVRARSTNADAEMARAEGNEDPALWHRTAVLWHGFDRPYRVAYARWREAEAALGGGHPRNVASAALRAGQEIAVRLGAKPLRAEIEALAQRARIDLEAAEIDSEPGTAPAAPEPTDHPLGLTGREVEVLRLVAEGLTNPQIGRTLFISPKTASIHVSNILRKLGVSSRVEAAGIAHRLGLARSKPTEVPTSNLKGLAQHIV